MENDRKNENFISVEKEDLIVFIDCVEDSFFDEPELMLVAERYRKLILNEDFIVNGTPFKSTWSSSQNWRKIIKKGVVAILPHVWSPMSNGELTKSVDIKVTLGADMSIGDALALLEKEALVFLMSQGADHMRHYFIEHVIISSTSVEFLAGT